MFTTGHLALPETLRKPQRPIAVPQPKLIAWNESLALELGLAELSGDPTRITQIFSGNDVPPGTEPQALAYAGHQFGHFVPQLGDGRAVLLGERTTLAGTRVDVQLKGSGRTFFSRGGDGKSALGPVLREYIVSEAMHRLGVETTRALAAVTTGEIVHRDPPQPGAVLTRVASSHLRVGTFEYLAARGDATSLRQLIEVVIARHYAQVATYDEPLLALFEQIVVAQARLVASWMALGFIHGVMNTDNTSISGETIDCGPCAFMDEFRTDKVFSSIDRYGRYAYNQQPVIATWNLARLGSCLLLLHDDQAAFEAILEQFDAHYLAHYHTLMARKLGIDDWLPDDAALIDDWLAQLEIHELDYSQSWRQLARTLTDDERPDLPTDFVERWRLRVQRSGRANQAVRRSMDATNPALIPRNHQIERAIVAAEDGDFSVFHALREALSQPYELAPAAAEFARPPLPHERVTQTFCGT